MAKRKLKFEDVKWGDLNSWAGSKIVDRGRSYKSQVMDLSLTEDGDLLAWVLGAEQYATKVWIRVFKLESDCTCPYEFSPCKHAVAVILAYLDRLKEKKKIKRVKADDPRLKLLENGWFEDWQEMPEILDEEIEEPLPSSSSTNDIKSFLIKKKKSELIDWILDIIEQEPALYNKIFDEKNLKQGNIKQVCKSIRSDINEITEEPVWSHWGRGESHFPDYSDIKDKFEELLKAGHADELIQLGELLLARGRQQIEYSHDDGMIAMDIGQCMEIVFQALPQSSLSKDEQLVWMIEEFMNEDYGILNECEAFLNKRIYKKADWEKVSHTLENRLQNKSFTSDDREFYCRYKREQLIEWIIHAYHKGGRKADIVPLYEREVESTKCYDRLVKYLIETKQYKKAKEWAYHGFEMMIESLPGRAWSLEADLRKIAEIEKDIKLVASFRFWEFIREPSLHSYQELQKAAKPIRKWPIIRKAALHYLETGEMPNGYREKATKKENQNHTWPLPPCGLSLASPKHPTRFPNVLKLIDIAMEEDRPDDVLKWYKVKKKEKRIFSNNDDQIAEALQERYPETSLEIWSALVESNIARKKPSAYQTAALYLRKMKALYQKGKRTKEWESYLSSLRDQHKPKRRLMEILDSMEGQRIIDA